jgi:adenosylcobinamide-GDP ribazoletransferase
LPAVGLLTPVPIPTEADFSEYKFNGASRYFPVAGRLVAAGPARVFVATAALVGKQLTAVLLAMGAAILLTGACHEDGFLTAASV